MKKNVKLVILLIALIIVAVTLSACNEDYGSPGIFYDGAGNSLSFDGKGNCTAVGLDCTYTLKNNVYSVTYPASGVTRDYTLVANGVLVDFAKGAGNIGTTARDGYISTTITIADETYTLKTNGTFDVEKYPFTIARGNYYLNDGVLVFEHTMSLLNNMSWSNSTWYVYGYVADTGNLVTVFLSNPDYYKQQHSNDVYQQPSNPQDPDTNPNQNPATNPSQNTVTLSYVAGTGGGVSGSAYQTITKGQSGTSVTAVPNSGYRFLKWSDGITALTRQDTNMTNSLSVTAQFEQIPKYSVIYNASAGGSISGNAYQTVMEGESSTAVTAVPNMYFIFVQWSDGVPTATRQDVIAAYLNVTAQFQEIPSYTLTYLAGEGGSIDGGTYHTVREGESGWEVTAKPNSGYRFVQWSDGVTTATRQDTNITSSITVTAYFELIPTYTVTYIAGTGGYVGNLLKVEETVLEGQGYSITANPVYGYKFVQWSDGVTTAYRHDTDIKTSFTVTAYFEYVGY